MAPAKQNRAYASDTLKRGKWANLGEAVDFVNVGVYAVGDGDVYEPVVGAQRHSRLGALLGQRVQPGPRPASQDDTQHRLQYKRPQRLP